MLIPACVRKNSQGIAAVTPLSPTTLPTPRSVKRSACLTMAMNKPSGMPSTSSTRPKRTFIAREVRKAASTSPHSSPVIDSPPSKKLNISHGFSYVSTKALRLSAQ